MREWRDWPEERMYHHHQHRRRKKSRHDESDEDSEEEEDSAEEGNEEQSEEGDNDEGDIEEEEEDGEEDDDEEDEEEEYPQEDSEEFKISGKCVLFAVVLVIIMGAVIAGVTIFISKNQEDTDEFYPDQSDYPDYSDETDLPEVDEPEITVTATPKFQDDATSTTSTTTTTAAPVQYYFRFPQVFRVGHELQLNGKIMKMPVKRSVELVLQQSEEDDSQKLVTVNVVSEERKAYKKNNMNEIVNRILGYMKWQTNSENKQVNFSVGFMAEDRDFTLGIRRLGTHLLLRFNATGPDGKEEIHQARSIYPLIDIRLNVLKLTFIGIKLQPWKLLAHQELVTPDQQLIYKQKEPECYKTFVFSEPFLLKDDVIILGGSIDAEDDKDYYIMDFIGNEDNNIYLHISLRPGSSPSDFKLVMKSAKLLEYNRWGWNNDPKNKDKDTRDNPFIKGQSFVLALRKDTSFFQLTISVASRTATYHWTSTGSVDTIRVSNGIHIDQCELYRNSSASVPAKKSLDTLKNQVLTANSTGPPIGILQNNVDELLSAAYRDPPNSFYVQSPVSDKLYDISFLLNNELEVYGTIDAKAKNFSVFLGETMGLNKRVALRVNPIFKDDEDGNTIELNFKTVAKWGDAKRVAERDHSLQRSKEFIIRIRRDIQHFIVSFNCSSMMNTVVFPYGDIASVFIKNLWFSGQVSIRKFILLDKTALSIPKQFLPITINKLPFTEDLGNPFIKNIAQITWNELQLSIQTTKYDHEFSVSLLDKNKKEIFTMTYYKKAVKFGTEHVKPFMCENSNFVLSVRKTNLKKNTLVVVAHCLAKMMTWYWDKDITRIHFLSILNEDYIVTDFSFIRTF